MDWMQAVPVELSEKMILPACDEKIAVGEFPVLPVVPGAEWMGQ